MSLIYQAEYVFEENDLIWMYSGPIESEEPEEPMTLEEEFFSRKGD